VSDSQDMTLVMSGNAVNTPISSHSDHITRIAISVYFKFPWVAHLYSKVILPRTAQCPATCGFTADVGRTP